MLRIAAGWLIFYAGITKVLDPAWSAAGYLNSAKTFTAFYQWWASPGVLSFTNFINEWGLTILGVWLSGVLGALLMILYYFPVLDFPYIAPHSYIVDDHIIYALVLLALSAFRAGRYWGLEKWCAGLPICKQFPKLREWIG